MCVCVGGEWAALMIPCSYLAAMGRTLTDFKNGSTLKEKYLLVEEQLFFCKG